MVKYHSVDKKIQSFSYGDKNQRKNRSIQNKIEIVKDILHKDESTKRKTNQLLLKKAKENLYE